ncbi:MAG: glucosidase [Jaaginema sp. PMC 1080.18]|nr:glucosidase [Jaaginema sp. PMC 1080.18]MEC4865652.1 glucosidase [Jaaginema sp. PMC 1078.18]
MNLNPQQQQRHQTAEVRRLTENRDRTAYWRRWGTYLSERQWGTVREDYSEDGQAWEYFSYQDALYRAYRWGEDGICGWCDNHQRLCFAAAFWNEKDPILKERLFGLTGKQGNHGEDVKEYYYYLDNLPSHAYAKALYRYSQKAYPYEELVRENQRRDRQQSEYEIHETGIFDQRTYFDIYIEYAKKTDEDILIQYSITNRAETAATLHVLPTLWFRNDWSWDKETPKPQLQKVNTGLITAEHPSLGQRWLYFENANELLFTENETNCQHLYGTKNQSPYTKDGLNAYVVNGAKNAVNPEMIGTKFAPHYILELQPGETQTVRLRLCDNSNLQDPFGEEFEQIYTQRRQESEAFYQTINPFEIRDDWDNIQRQAFAGLLWNKQHYLYIIERWLKGDPTQPEPPKGHQNGRNQNWSHIFCEDVLSMADSWEYPWFAVWDLAFHTIPLSLIDPDYAKQQLDLFTREWYMNPNGQLPAYEWNFNDVNPPVHAWAVWRVYKIEKKMYGRCDRQFLERVFQKLLLTFTWWVNRKDPQGNNVFRGGFLGLDNIGIFDRSEEPPTGGYIEQSDGTSWMVMFCLNMLSIALELAQENPVYEDIASKFFEHFLYIVNTMNHFGTEGTQLWDEEDGFYYDVLHLPDGQNVRLKIRSIVGLIPLFAVAVIDSETLEKLPNFEKRVQWFLENRPDLSRNIACMESCGIKSRRLLAIPDRERLEKILARMLDEAEFFSPYGIRSLSRHHQEHPYTYKTDGETYCVQYEPAESSSPMFGGNSNWRGPVWFPINFLIIEALQEYYYYWGDQCQIECPTGSGHFVNLWEVACELEHRLIAIFSPNKSGQRPVNGEAQPFKQYSDWQDQILFYEYFHGDNGSGLGACHQTGWTGLVAKLILQCSEYPRD